MTKVDPKHEFDKIGGTLSIASAVFLSSVIILLKRELSKTHFLGILIFYVSIFLYVTYLLMKRNYYDECFYSDYKKKKINGVKSFDLGISLEYYIIFNGAKNIVKIIIPYLALFILYIFLILDNLK